MKKVLALAVAAVMGLAAQASDIYVGGNLGVWHDETADATTAKILPEIGYNLSDKWAIGTTIGYAYAGASGVHNNSFVFNPYARFSYFKHGIVSLFVDGGVDMAFGKTKVKGYGSSDTSASFGIGFKPGIALNLNDKFSLVAHMGRFGFDLCNDAAEAGGFHKGYGLDLWNSVSFGFYYNF